MAVLLTVRDETTSGDTLQEFALELPRERLTVRELIRSRVYQEVKDFNVRQPAQFPGLIQPGDAEMSLNGVRDRGPRKVDWKRQFERALTAFRSNQIIVLLDNRQLEELDEEIEIEPGAKVSFLRLTLLAGG